MDSRERAKELIPGSIDFHIHSGPDIFPRLMNDIEIAECAKAAGMRAVLLKSHIECTGARASIASNMTGFPVFGGLTLNHAVGGLNPEAVRIALKMGAKEIWMPTIHAEHYLKAVDNVPMFAKVLKGDIKGISIINDDKTLKDEVKEIIELIAEADVVLATGHISVEEAMILVTEAKKGGVKKCVVTHPTSPMEGYTEEDMKEIVARGAMLEHVVNDITHQMKNPISPSIIADAIRAVGAENTIMSTDSGQAINPAPVTSMENFIYEMLKLDIEEADIIIMTRNNPAKMLGIEV
jgi:hypothetical protein